MNFDHQEFSKTAKVMLNDYLDQRDFNLNDLEVYIEKVQKVNLGDYKNDQEKLAFWINVYNGLTNYMIIKNGLQKSVWEKGDFFSDRVLKVGPISFSLDDIEHGILRRNGPRKNNKPRQLKADDPREEFMLECSDYRIHFALNCGSISCPPIAYYSAQGIEEELALAKRSYAGQEFVIDHELKQIHCSSIFLWYRMDFGELYLNDPSLSQYTIHERPYIWKIQ